MKLLFETIDRPEIENARILLEGNGIPIFISNDDTARNMGFIYPARKMGFWVALDHQYQDAILLLENGEHVVSHPVDVGEYYAKLDAEGKRSTEKLFDKLALVIVILIISGFSLYLYFRITGT